MSNKQTTAKQECSVPIVTPHGIIPTNPTTNVSAQPEIIKRLATIQDLLERLMAAVLMEEEGEHSQSE